MKTHEFDVLSFLSGLLITAIGLAFLLLADLNDIIDVLTDAGSWFWPAVFIAVGVAILAPLAARGRTTGEEDDSDATQILSD